jgi:hypothetical protein
MFRKQLRSHTGKDGVLNLQVSVGLPDQDVDVFLLVESKGSSKKDSDIEKLRKIMGGWQGQTLVREEQADYEKRENLE